MGDTLHVQLYPRAAHEEWAVDFAFFANRAAADGDLAPRIPEFLEAARKARCIVLACDRRLDDEVASHIGGSLRPGEWRAWTAKHLVVRLAGDDGFATPWHCPPQGSREFRGGFAQQMDKLQVVWPMKIVHRATTVYFASMAPALSFADYGTVHMKVRFAGIATPVPEKYAKTMRAIPIPFPRNGEPPRAVVQAWNAALSEPGSVLVVAPVFFMLDLYRFILSKTEPVHANARARKAFREAFCFEAPVTGVPCMRPYDLPLSDGPRVVK